VIVLAKWIGTSQQNPLVHPAIGCVATRKFPVVKRVTVSVHRAPRVGRVANTRRAAGDHAPLDRRATHGSSVNRCTATDPTVVTKKAWREAAPAPDTEVNHVETLHPCTAVPARRPTSTTPRNLPCRSAYARPMARPPMSAERRRHQMIQATRREIARGEHVVLRVLIAPDGSWSVEVALWLTGTAASRSEALAAARAAVAAMLEVEPDAFEVAAGGSR
jgi:hypothetical protein